jgi:hypothetical protein
VVVGYQDNIRAYAKRNDENPQAWYSLSRFEPRTFRMQFCTVEVMPDLLRLSFTFETCSPEIWHNLNGADLRGTIWHNLNPEICTVEVIPDLRGTSFESKAESQGSLDTAAATMAMKGMNSESMFGERPPKKTRSLKWPFTLPTHVRLSSGVGDMCGCLSSGTARSSN